MMTPINLQRLPTSPTARIYDLEQRLRNLIQAALKATYAYADAETISDMSSAMTALASEAREAQAPTTPFGKHRL